MVKIEAVIQPHKLEEATAALAELDICEITISEVLDYGASVSTYYRGSEYRSAVSRVKVEMLVADDDVDAVTSAVLRAAKTREAGDRDGRILVYQVADAIRIHSGVHIQHVLA
jgi:nitrogen regulatory protein P-II 1